MKKSWYSYTSLLLLLVLVSKLSLGQSSLPSVNIKSINGTSSSFSEITQSSGDSAVVVSFWATWCIPCVAELDNISDELSDKQKEMPFRFMGISVDDSRTANRVRPFVKGKGWKFDVYQDLNSELKRALNITDIPHVLIVKNGKIVYRHTGYIAGEEENLFEEIKKITTSK
jgi:thiol-disulfide isomerase/thioredoxin